MSTPTSNTVNAYDVTVKSNKYWIDSLLKGKKWGSDVVGNEVTLTYSFPGASCFTSLHWDGQYSNFGEPWNGAKALSATDQAAVKSALSCWSSVANVVFEKVGDDTTTVGDIRVAWTKDASAGAWQAWAYSPGGDPCNGDVWLCRDAYWGGGLGKGSYGYLTLIHELGHALGLSHTFDADSLGGELPSSVDGYHYSVMSYTALAGVRYSSASFNPTTPMLYDIAAMQYLYGANTSYAAGDNVYTFKQGQKYFQTIWDGGGSDTIVWSATTESATIDLRAGNFSDLGNTLKFWDDYYTYTSTSTVAIAYGVTIENATGGNANDILIGNDVANCLNGGSGADRLDGGLGNDTLIGGSGNDTLAGGSGEPSSVLGSSDFDSLVGGSGDDVYIVASSNAAIVEATGGGTDLVRSRMHSCTLSDNVENLLLEGLAALNGTGNSLANRITGSSRGNSLVGGDGNDTLDGAYGDDTLVGGAGNDTYYVDSSLDVIVENGNDGFDQVYVYSGSVLAGYVLSENIENATILDGQASRLVGNALGNVLTGNSAANTLDGASGADKLTGGLGNDTYIIDNSGDVIVETSALATEVDLVLSSVSYTLGANLEKLTLSGSGDLSGIGNSLSNAIAGNIGNNTLTGNAGNDTLNGGVGADSMNGGAGNDTYVVDNAGDIVTELANGGSDTVISSLSYTLADKVNIENLTLTGAAVSGTGNALSNVITGNSGNNTLTGGAGNDTLDGGLYADTMDGGLGNDLYYVDSAGDVVIELASGGTDIVFSSQSYILGANDNIENLTLTATALAGTGNGLNNVITGNGGNNMIDGGAGVDTLIGGIGDDTYSVELKKVGTGAKASAALNDVVTEAAASGTDKIVLTGVLDNTAYTTFTLAANIEQMDASATVNTLLNLTGNTADNILTGNAAANILNGGVGADTLYGGAGDDTYLIDNVGDIVSESANNGMDLVKVGIATKDLAYALTANVENATLTNTVAFNLTGNGLDNVLTGNAAANSMVGAAGNDALMGNAGNDTLDGGLGADSMNGGAGNDTYVVDNVDDVVTELTNGGTDTVISSQTYTLADKVNIENLTLTGTAALSGTGNALNNVIAGNSGNNTLTGNAGNDTLDGGVGADSMSGGLGNDTYLVDNVGDLVTEDVNSGIDLVKVGISTTGMTYTLADNVENVMLTSTVVFNLTGNALNNVITGNSSDNAINGGAGADTLIGGAGDDTYTVELKKAGTGAKATAALNDVVTEATASGTDKIVLTGTVDNSIYTTLTLAANIEQLDAAATGSTLLNLTGNTTANILAGNAAANTLNGGVGADTLYGGAGDDTYLIDNVGDVVNESASNGMDLVKVGIVTKDLTYTLTANVENATLTNAVAFNLTGNTLDNVLTGNAAANVLNGGLGSDTLTGGAGIDRFVFDTIDVLSHADTITDFLSGTDKIVLSASVFSGFGAVGATTGLVKDFLNYDRTTGALSYDQDGTGINSAATFAYLESKTGTHPVSLGSKDFLIVA